jgi:acetoacetate decarboxylase
MSNDASKLARYVAPTFAEESMIRDRFFDRPRLSVTTSQGVVELPALCRDATTVFAFFRVDYDRAAKVVSATPFVPVRFATGFAVAGLGMLDYRDMSLGAYRECALALAVAPRGARPPALPILDLFRGASRRSVGLHILDLPVTTAFSTAAGRELWGFPKFVASIDLRVGPDVVRGAVSAGAGDDPIVVLEGHAGRGAAVPATDIVLYSVHRGEALRTVVNTRGRVRTSTGGDLVVRVGGGAPMSGRIAALGLDGARASLTQVCHHAEMVFHPGAPLAHARAA